MEKTPGKSSQGAIPGSKSSHGSHRNRRSSRDPHPGMPETPPVGLVSCDPSTTNQMLQSWYNYSMYNMFLNAVANQAAVADMMNRSQMQLMPDLTSPKAGVPQRKASPVQGVPMSQSHNSQRHTTPHTHSSTVTNNTATSTSRNTKPIQRKDAPSQPAGKVHSVPASVPSTNRAQHRSHSSAASLPRTDSSSVKDSRSRQNTQPPAASASTSSNSSHVQTRNIIPAHIKKETNKLIDDLIHKAYGKSKAPSTKTVVPAHSKKELTSVPDRSRDSYQNVFRPRSFTAKQLTDPTSDIPKSCLQDSADNALAVLDLSKSKSVSSSSYNCPTNQKTEVSPVSFFNAKDSCSSSVLTARQTERKNGRGILSKRPRIMDNPYLQKVCAAGLKTVPGNATGTSYANEAIEGSNMLKLESTEVSSMIDRLFTSVGESSGSGIEEDQHPKLEDFQQVKNESQQMETDYVCDEVTSSESPFSKSLLDQTTGLKTPRRVSPGSDNLVSSCGMPMELSPPSGNDLNESPSGSVTKETYERTESTNNQNEDNIDAPLSHLIESVTTPTEVDQIVLHCHSGMKSVDNDSSNDVSMNSTLKEHGELEHNECRNENSHLGSNLKENDAVPGFLPDNRSSVNSTPKLDHEIKLDVNKSDNVDTPEVKTEKPVENNDEIKGIGERPKTEIGDQVVSNLCSFLDPETGLFKLRSPKTELEDYEPKVEEVFPIMDDESVTNKFKDNVNVESKSVYIELESKHEINSDDTVLKSEPKNETNDSDSFNFPDDISENSATPYFSKTWNFRERRYESDKGKPERKSLDGDSKSLIKMKQESESNAKRKSGDKLYATSEKSAGGSEYDETPSFPTYASGSVFPGFDLDSGANSENPSSDLLAKKEPSEVSFSSTYTGKFVSDSEDTGSLPGLSHAALGSTRGRGTPRGRKGKRGRKECNDGLRQSHLCKKCGLAFAREGELERHKRSHLGQKLYVCEYCHKSFVRGYYYKLHVSLHEVNDAPTSPKPDTENMDHSDTKDISSHDEDSDLGDMLMEDSVSQKGNNSDSDDKPLKELTKESNDSSIKETNDNKTVECAPPLEDFSAHGMMDLDLVDGENVKQEIKTEQEVNKDQIYPLKMISVETSPKSKAYCVPARRPSPVPGPSHSLGAVDTNPAHKSKRLRTPSPVLSAPVPSQAKGFGGSQSSNWKKAKKTTQGPVSIQTSFISNAQTTSRKGNDVHKSNGCTDAFLNEPGKDESLGLQISSDVLLPPKEEEPRAEMISPKPSNSGIGQFTSFSSGSNAQKSSTSLKREFLDDISGADSLSRASILASAGLTVDTNITANYANSTMVTATPETDFSLILNTDPIPCTPSDFIFPDDEMMFTNSPKEYLDLDTTTRAKVSGIDPMKLLHVDNIFKIEPNDQVVLNIKVETDVHFGILESLSKEGMTITDVPIIKKEELSEEGRVPACASPCSPLSGIDFNDLGSWDDSESLNLEPVQEDLTYRPMLPEVPRKSLAKGSRKGIKKPRKAKFLHRFKCNKCPKDFARYGDLKKHESQHSGENLCICEVCGKAFLRRCLYLIHLKRHQEGRYVHQQCGLRFPSKTALKTHMRFCNTYKYCGKKGDTHFTLLKNGGYSKRLPSRSSLEKGDNSDIENSETSISKFEIEQVESERGGIVDINSKFDEKVESNGGIAFDKSDNGEYSCDICSKKFLWLSGLVYHKRCHSGEKPYKCRQCNKTFRAAGALRIHIRYHNNERPYVCEICGKSYTERGTLKSHMKVHTGERKYKCEHCNRSFAWREHMRYHIKTHTGEKPHKCDECGKCFADRSSLKIHWRSHSDDRPYACGMCEMRYKSSKQLLVHRRIHTGETPYKCSDCKKQFRALGNLKRHQLTHTKEKPLKCKFCTKRFRSHSNLNEHMNIHTGNKPHECKICHKKFANSGSLAKHIGTHSDEKRFECDHCKKCFRDKGDLKSHMRSHTGERPYACVVCGQRFKHSCHVKKHMRTHNRKK